MFFRTSSSGLTPQIAATGMTAQGISVPPSTQMVMICPREASISLLTGRACENVTAVAPTMGRPEKPEPSSPVTKPASASASTTGTREIGTFCARYRPMSFMMPVDSPPNTALAPSALPRKKNPAMNTTGAKISMPKPNPSLMWSMTLSSAFFTPPLRQVAAHSMTSAVPPTSAVASPPCSLKTSMSATSSAKASGVTTAITRAAGRGFSREAARSTLTGGSFFTSRRNMMKATVAVTTAMTAQSSMLSWISAPTEVSAALAVIVGAPCMKKSPESAMPWPNRFIATAAHTTGMPVSSTSGSMMAPTSATAGEGQMQMDTANMMSPSSRNVTLLFFM